MFSSKMIINEQIFKNLSVVNLAAKYSSVILPSGKVNIANFSRIHFTSVFVV